jgi:hypothetical protein
MSQVAPPPPPTEGPGQPARPNVVDALARGWFTALVRGVVAFLVMAALGEAIGFAVYAVGRTHGSIGRYAELGWLYFGWFHHIPIDLAVKNLSIASQVGGIASSLGSVSYHLGLALMFATFAAIWLLYAGGRAVADRADGGGVARVLHGLKVAPIYAALSLVVSLGVRLTVGIPHNEFINGTVEMKLSPLGSFLIPLLIAAVAGAAGGLRSGRYEILAREPWGRRAAGALAGGLRMLVLGLILSFAGLLVMAVVMPDATRGYFAAVSEPPTDATAVIIAHHVLVLPNQSMWVLVPAMGGCDGVRGTTVSTSFLCYWHFPRQLSLGPISLPTSAPRVSTQYGTAPPGYFLFLLVPLLSVLLGGRHAARKRARYRYEAVGVGAAAGMVFAALVAVAAWFASLTAGFSAGVASYAATFRFRIGPDVVTGALLALVWGVVGGAVGGWLAGRELPARAPISSPAGFGERMPAGTATGPMPERSDEEPGGTV